MIYLKGHFFSLTKMTIVIIWQFFLVSELNSCERRIFLVYFYCHMSTLRIKWETYITRDRQILLVHCVENSLNFKMSYDIWKLTKCSSTYNHLFTVLSFLRKLITIPMGGKGLRYTSYKFLQYNFITIRAKNYTVVMLCIPFHLG